MLNDRLARNREKEKQLVDRFSALIGEGRYDEALKVANTVSEVDPNGVTPVVATVSSQLMRNNYLMQLTRHERWRNYFDTLYQVETSAIPFPDEPPIVYPDARVWEDLSNRRKDRYGSMDLKATGEAEQRIEKALRSPLLSTGLDFADVPLQEVVTQLSSDYGIQITLNKPALEEAGIGTDAPVNIQLHNVSLRSALRLMLKQLQLTYIIQDEVLMITTKEDAEQQLVVKVYPVADLVLPIDATTLGGNGGGLGGGISGGGGGGGAVAAGSAAVAVGVWEVVVAADSAAVVAAASLAFQTIPSRHHKRPHRRTPRSMIPLPQSKARRRPNRIKTPRFRPSLSTHLKNRMTSGTLTSVAARSIRQLCAKPSDN